MSLAGTKGSFAPCSTRIFDLMFFPSSGDGESRPPWKLTTPLTAAPLRANSSTPVPPKQYPIAAILLSATPGCARHCCSPRFSRRRFKSQPIVRISLQTFRCAGRVIMPWIGIAIRVCRRDQSCLTGGSQCPARSILAANEQISFRAANTL